MQTKQANTDLCYVGCTLLEHANNVYSFLGAQYKDEKQHLTQDMMPIQQQKNVYQFQVSHPVTARQFHTMNLVKPKPFEAYIFGGKANGYKNDLFKILQNGSCMYNVIYLHLLR